MTSNNRTSRSNFRNQGFTLLELMVTVALAALLFAIAIPSFRAVIGNNRLVTQTNDMVGALQTARSEAITRNLSVTLCRAALSTDTTCTAGAATATWDFWLVRNSAGTVVRSGSVPGYGGAMKVKSTFTSNSVVFTSDGLAHNGTASTGALLTTAEVFNVCATTISTLNFRTITPGSGSRLSTAQSTGAC